MKQFALVLLGVAMTWGSTVHAGEPVELYAAGSLRAALTDVAEAFSERHGVEVNTTFAPSGLLRQRIEEGERPHVFASANMAHPRTLAERGTGGPVVMFARNRLCGLAQPELEVSTDSFLDVLLDDDIRVGTSTPNADPSGDYAWELFEKAEQVRPGSFDTLNVKARKLTGGPDSPKPPEGRNNYAWVMTEDRADIFLTYCTNAVLARQDTESLEIVQVPASLSVGADYGLTVLAPDHPDATRLALFILSDAGQAILHEYGFDTPTRVASDE